jgi:hypothetical protein
LSSPFPREKLFVGKGAGKEPTAEAAFRDLIAVTNGYSYEAKSLETASNESYEIDGLLKLYASSTTENLISESDFESVETIKTTNGYTQIVGVMRNLKFAELSERETGDLFICLY